MIVHYIKNNDMKLYHYWHTVFLFRIMIFTMFQVGNY